MRTSMAGAVAEEAESGTEMRQGAASPRRGRRAATASAAVAVTLLTGVLAAGGTGGAGAEERPAAKAQAGRGAAGAGVGAYRQRAVGRFAPVRAFVRSDAVTYDRGLVPAGASIAVTERVDRHGNTVVGAAVRGLRPDRTFGVHVHTKPCGADPKSSGPHYQNRRDPVRPSTDPAYANPHNEVWLDMHTDDSGDARRATRHHWRFRAGAARSVALHEHATDTKLGHAGEAGGRAACFTVPFNGGRDGRVGGSAGAHGA